MIKNHVIDPNYFDEAIEQFAFNYTWFPQKGIDVDDMGRVISSFDKQTIRGSLQVQEAQYNQKIEGNTTTLKYKFYCKSIYRIEIGDFILHKNKFLHVDGIHDYDEWGVREATLTMVNLNDYKDFREYIKYLEGEEIV